MENEIIDLPGITTTSSAVNGLSYSRWYYWRVRAVNNNGMGSWSPIWSFQTQSQPGGGGGGCPSVLGWNGERFLPDNNLLPQSEYPGNDGKPVTDTYKLLLPPKLSEDRKTYELQIREFEHEHTQLDQVELLAIEHPIANGIAVQPATGEIIEYTTPYRLGPAENDEQQIALSDMDGRAMNFQKGTGVSLRFQNSDGQVGRTASTQPSPIGILLGGWIMGNVKGYSLPKLASVGAVGGSPSVSVGDAGDKNNHFTFRERPTLTYVPLNIAELQEGDAEVHVQFTERVALDYAALVRQVKPDYTLYRLKLLSAVHSANGSITRLLSAKDDLCASLYPGDAITLTFEAPPQAKDPLNKTLSFVLVSTGKSEHLIWDNVSGDLPRSFHLDQNHPNPFNPQTVLSYALSANSGGMYVTLTIYDLLGREIARLVDGPQNAGYYERIWDGSNEPSGVYYARLIVRDLQSGKPLYTQTRKLILMK